MSASRLLDRNQAKAYLGGVDPDKVLPPLRYGRRVRWDRRALDRALDRASGISTVTPKEAKSAFDEWSEAQA